jgi:predicted nuclease with TOPRIM domain
MRRREVRQTIVRVAVMAALVVAGLSAGLGYGHLQVGREQQNCQKKTNELNRKMALLQKKASDEREARSGVEGQKRSLQAEVDRLRKENGERAEATKKLEADAQSYEAKLKEITEQLDMMKAARDQVSAQLAQVLQAARELEGQAKLLASGKQTLEASLAKVNKDLDGCRDHNARLCLIADEILKKQQSRGAMAGILKSEPLTQIGKVELERLTQEYKEKIEKEKVRDK